MTVMDEVVSYRSVEVCRLSGCSYRQLDWWSRIGVFGEAGQASGSGSRRVGFTDADVRLARGLSRLSAAGILGGQAISGSRSPGRVSQIDRFARTLRDCPAETQAIVFDLGHGVNVSVSLADDLSEP